jgi:hypothetical protein
MNLHQLISEMKDARAVINTDLVLPSPHPRNTQSHQKKRKKNQSK